MKKRIVKFLCARGWWRLAYRISPSLAHYFAAVGIVDSQGYRGRAEQEQEQEV